MSGRRRRPRSRSPSRSPSQSPYGTTGYGQASSVPRRDRAPQPYPGRGDFGAPQRFSPRDSYASRQFSPQRGYAPRQLSQQGWDLEPSYPAQGGYSPPHQFQPRDSYASRQFPPQGDSAQRQPPSQSWYSQQQQPSQSWDRQQQQPSSQTWDADQPRPRFEPVTGTWEAPGESRFIQQSPRRDYDDVSESEFNSLSNLEIMELLGVGSRAYDSTDEDYRRRMRRILSHRDRRSERRREDRGQTRQDARRPENQREVRRSENWREARRQERAHTPSNRRSQHDAEPSQSRQPTRREAGTPTAGTRQVTTSVPGTRVGNTAPIAGNTASANSSAPADTNLSAPAVTIATNVPKGGGSAASNSAQAAQRGHPSGHAVLIPRGMQLRCPEARRLAELMEECTEGVQERMFTDAFGTGFGDIKRQVYASQYGCEDQCHLGLCLCVFGGGRKKCDKDCTLTHGWPDDDTIRVLLTHLIDAQRAKARAFLLRAITNWEFHKKNGWLAGKEDWGPPRGPGKVPPQKKPSNSGGDRGARDHQSQRRDPYDSHAGYARYRDRNDRSADARHAQ